MNYGLGFECLCDKTTCVDCVYNMIGLRGNFECDLARREGAEIPNEARVVTNSVGLKGYSFDFCFLSLDDLLFGELMEEVRREYENV